MLLELIKRAGLALLAVLALTGAAMADVTFTGQVTYRERIALPPGAELRVTLVSMADRRAVVGATATIAAQGGVPLQFNLNVRSNVDPDRQYGLLAEISHNGQVLFRNEDPVHVDAVAPNPVRILVQYHPEPIVPPEPPAAALADTQWTVVMIGAAPLLDGSRISLAIAADQRISGRACNNYFAEGQFGADTVEFGPVAGTRMACAPDLMNQEAAFFGALGAARSYKRVGTDLEFYDAEGDLILRLAPQTAA